mmetsp:Transcript_26741/g.68739  ORF Transcript_26741/g.68739 Transcript_26741/m.68739 type:complete len:107 (-) Transcript_26741:1483-1803(-)
MDVIVLGCPPPINREDKKIRRARRKEESSLMGRRALKLSSFPYVATAFDHDAGSFALLLVRGSLVQVMATFFLENFNLGERRSQAAGHIKRGFDNINAVIGSVGGN